MPVTNNGAIFALDIELRKRIVWLPCILLHNRADLDLRSVRHGIFFELRDETINHSCARIT